MKGNEVKSRAIKEAIREIDAEIDENKYAWKKLRDNYDFYDIEARNSFTKSKVTTSMIKCANGMNPYGVQNNMINKQIIGNECPRCSEVETWEHVVKYKETIPLRRKFIIQLLKELNDKHPDSVEQEEILLFVEDILQYLEDDKNKEYEINQGMISVRNLFRGYAAKV